MEILPNIGLGPLRFGMNPSQVQALLGPQGTYEPWMGGNLNQFLAYPGLLIGFDKVDGRGPLEDSKLDEFLINEKTDVTFLKKPIFGMQENELVETLTQHGIRSEKNLSSYQLPDLCMELDLDEQGRVSWIEFWGQGYLKKSFNAQRQMNELELEDAKRVLDWQHWAPPLALTLTGLALLAAFWHEELSAKVFIVVLFGVPSALFWLLFLRAKQRVQRDVDARMVGIVHGSPDKVWRNGFGICFVSLAGKKIRVPAEYYDELQAATSITLEYLPESLIALRIRHRRRF